MPVLPGQPGGIVAAGEPVWQLSGSQSTGESVGIQHAAMPPGDHRKRFTPPRPYGRPTAYQAARQTPVLATLAPPPKAATCFPPDARPDGTGGLQAEAVHGTVQPQLSGGWAVAGDREQVGRFGRLFLCFFAFFLFPLPCELQGRAKEERKMPAKRRNRPKPGLSPSTASLPESCGDP